MALREGVLQMLFAGGVETKSDPKTVPSVRLLGLENGVFARASSIRKRNGYDALSQTIDGSASMLTDAIRMAGRGDELLAISPTRAYSRQDDADQWSDTGAVMSAVGADRSLVRTGTQQLQPDQASLAGITAAAWEDSLGGVWWSVVGEGTGRIHRAPTQADALGRSPRVVPVGPNLHIYYAVPTTTSIMLIIVNPAAPSAAVTPVQLVTDLDATHPHYDATPTTRTGTPALIAWLEASTTNIRIGYVDASGVLGSPATGHPSVLTVAANAAVGSPIAVAHQLVDGSTGDLLAIGYVDGPSNCDVAFLTGGSSSTAISVSSTRSARTATLVVRCALVLIDSVAWTAWEEDDAIPSHRATAIVDVGTGGGITVTATVRSVGLAARAFAIDDDAFVTLVHDTTFFNTYVTLRMSDQIAVGRHVPGSAAGAPLRNHLPSAHVAGSDVAMALPVRDRLISEPGDVFTETGIRLVTMGFDDDASHQTAQLGAGLYMAGACPQHYDGRVWTEQGFHFGPERIVAAAASGGSMTISTTYEYRCWYESTDAAGEIHRGPTSIGTLATMGGSDTQVTLTLPMLRVTGKSNVRIGVARSLAAETGKTAQLFRVTSLDPNTAGSPNGYVASSTSSNTATFVDRMSDADLADQEPLYTNGGVLSNDPAPLGAVVARGQTRLFFTDPSNGNVIRPSQPLDDGYGVELPPDLTIVVDPFGGDVTALAFQDGRGVIWKASAIFTFSGDGPLANGDTATSGFSAPQLITSDVGCTNPQSIVLTPFGHMFQSAKGIYLLDRSGQVSYIGAPMELYNAQTVRRATVMPDRTAVLFLTDSGLTLHFDYERGQWSTFSNHEGLDAAVVDGQFHYLRTDGRVFRETIGEYSDAGTRIRLRLETAWLHMQPHLQGFSRFWRAHLLGTQVSPHQLGVQYQTDYSPAWTDSYWLDATGLSSSTGWITGAGAATIGVYPITGTDYGAGEYGDGPYGGTTPDVYQWRVHLNEKGQSIRFRFEDFEASGYAGGSFELTELIVSGGVKAPTIRPFTAARST